MAKSSYHLYFVCGSQDCPQGQLLPVLEAALKAGITSYQFREKGPTSKQGQERLDLARQAQALCQAYKVPFIVNDDLNLALLLGADGLHIGQSDGTVETIRKVWPDKLLGLSISSWEQYQKAPLDQLDYIGVGPVFPTTSKADANPVVGTSLIERIKTDRPDLNVVAIGGLTAETAQVVRQAGADGLAVISAISRAVTIENAVANLL